MTWSSRRQLIIILVFITIILLLSIPIVAKIIPDPTCFDGRKNQDETGVDCGGICNKACLVDTREASVLWVRPFMVSDGVASAVAYISNPNPNYSVHNAKYVMKLYNKDGLLLSERLGVAHIPPRTSFPIFEGGFMVGTQVASSAYFEFTEELDWQRITEDLPKISFTSPIIDSEDLPRVYTKVSNDSEGLVRNIPIIAIVYNKEDNAIGVSETYIDKLERNMSEEIVFTWLQKFPGEVGRIEIYVRPEVAL